MSLQEFYALKSKKEKDEYLKKRIKRINESSKELDKLGIWSIPKKIKKGVEYSVWKAKE